MMEGNRPFDVFFVVDLRLQVTIKNDQLSGLVLEDVADQFGVVIVLGGGVFGVECLDEEDRE
jgi:hypothetical protein